MKLSVGIITFNEEKNLDRTLKSVKEIADEIIIVDNGSTDKTLEIAKKYEANIYIEKWKGYGLQKNSAIEKCKNDWILLIDADEEVSKPLAAKITEILNTETEKKVFMVNRRAICFGKKIKYGAYSKDYVHRLFRKKSGLFNDKHVHENFETTEQVFKIKEEINHYTSHTLEEYMQTLNRYTSESALEYIRKKRKKNVLLFILRSKFTFMRNYIFRLGILDGYEGYLLAKLSEIYTFIKYAKLKEKYEIK